MRPYLAILVMTGLLASCSESEFSGGSQYNLGQGRMKTDKDLKDNEEVTPTGLVVDDSGTIGECAKGTLIVDPDQKYSFSRGEERTFLNSLNRYVQIPTLWEGAGMVHADQASADTVCKLKGYNKAISFQTETWYSPHDNYNAHWIDSSKKFVLKGATESNRKLTQTVCQGRLHDKCDKNKNWIFQKP